jgi:hypothetical protein
VENEQKQKEVDKRLRRMAVETDFTQGIWFGPPPPQANRDGLMRTVADSAATNKDRATAAVELLKLGQFSAKTDVLDAMTVAEPFFRAACCSVFCAVAEHNEVADLIEVLDQSDEDEVRSSALYSVFTLSLTAIPFLLALAETWKGTELQQELCDAARTLIPLNGQESPSVAEMRTYYQSAESERMLPSTIFVVSQFLPVI